MKKEDLMKMRVAREDVLEAKRLRRKKAQEALEMALEAARVQKGARLSESHQSSPGFGGSRRW